MQNSKMFFNKMKMISKIVLPNIKLYRDMTKMMRMRFLL